MKKLTTILLCLILSASLTACTTSNAQPPATETAPAATQSPVTETAPTDTQTPTVESVPTEPTQPAESKPTSSEQTSPQTVETISRDRAIELALSEASLTKDQVRDLEAEMDRERGDLVWEVDFEFGKYEYSYDINAVTEEVVKVERDHD